MKVAGRVEIVSAATWIPEEYETLPPECDGLIPESSLPVLRVKSLPVARILAAPEMAVLAARDCLTQADWDTSRLHSLLHAHVYHQGHDWWPAAHYIANQLGTSSHTLPVVVQQGCNAGIVALEMAATTLLADSDADSVLLSTADRFGEPVWPRWLPGRPAGFGDGATAALLRRRGTTPTTLALLSIAHSSEPSLERLVRGESDFTPAPMWHKTAIVAPDPEAVRLAEEPTLEELLVAQGRTRESLARALADAELDPADRRIRYVVLPRTGGIPLDTQYGGVLDCLTHAEPMIFGEHTGHLGAGDPFANIVELRERGLLAPGEIAVILNAGAGMTWSTAIVEAGAGWKS